MTTNFQAPDSPIGQEPAAAQFDLVDEVEAAVGQVTPAETQALLRRLLNEAGYVHPDDVADPLPADVSESRPAASLAVLAALGPATVDCQTSMLMLEAAQAQLAEVQRAATVQAARARRAEHAAIEAERRAAAARTGADDYVDKALDEARDQAEAIRAEARAEAARIVQQAHAEAAAITEQSRVVHRSSAPAESLDLVMLDVDFTSLAPYGHIRPESRAGYAPADTVANCLADLGPDLGPAIETAIKTAHAYTACRDGNSELSAASQAGTLYQLSAWTARHRDQSIRLAALSGPRRQRHTGLELWLPGGTEKGVRIWEAQFSPGAWAESLDGTPWRSNDAAAEDASAHPICVDRLTPGPSTRGGRDGYWIVWCLIAPASLEVLAWWTNKRDTDIEPAGGSTTVSRPVPVPENNAVSA